MPRHTAPKGIKGVGKAIETQRRRRSEQAAAAPATTGPSLGVAPGQAGRSVLEQSSLDDFLAQAELAKASFESTRGERFQQEGPRLVSSKAGGSMSTEALEAKVAAAHRLVVPIPWRPQWREGGMTAEELASKEAEAFLDWRRTLARLEEMEDVVMTPYERNLDFWRQLWRCVDRSTLLVQILDARDPEFYRSQDLERYVKSFGSKQHLLLLNKADFLSPELRRSWAEYYHARGVNILFFSALRELHRQQRVPAVADVGSGGAEAAPLPPHGPLLEEDALDVADCSRLIEELREQLSLAAAEHNENVHEEASCRGGSSCSTVGFVGYPNVGKSSVINALFGMKKVSMSRTPGKTKHLQTLELPQLGLTLCDCPGLVFPSVVATKAHLVINGTVPLTELRDAMAPVRLIVWKVGFSRILQKYGISEAAVKDGKGRLGEAAAADSTHVLLAAFAAARQHFLRLGVPDANWAARRVLHDFCTGELLHCEAPVETPMAAPPPTGHGTAMAPVPALTAAEVQAAKALDEVPAQTAEGSDSDFSDLDAFLAGEAPEAAKPPPRRRAGKR